MNYGMPSLSKIKNKTRTYVLDTFTQHPVVGYSYWSKGRTANKSPVDSKGRSKPVLFAKNIIVYVENYEKSTKNILELK